MIKAKEQIKNRYRIEEIPIANILTEDQQIRDIQVDDDIHELASSIAALDLLQFPGVVQDENGYFRLAWGRRRIEAAKLLGWHNITCRVYEGAMQEIKALALVENLQRRAMSVAEECAAVRFLAEDQKLPIDTIVGQLGRSRSWVNLRLAVDNFPPIVKEALLGGDINLGAAEAIALCTDEPSARYIISQAHQAKLTIPEIRSMVQTSLDMPSQTQAINAGIMADRETHSYQEAHITCAACGQLRPQGRLQFVRICNDGCPTPMDTTTPSQNPPTRLDSANPIPRADLPTLPAQIS